jgi:hypothetical protein
MFERRRQRNTSEGLNFVVWSLEMTKGNEQKNALQKKGLFAKQLLSKLHHHKLPQKPKLQRMSAPQAKVRVASIVISFMCCCCCDFYRYLFVVMLMIVESCEEVQGKEGCCQVHN